MKNEIWKKQNELAMSFLQRQIKTEDNSQFQAGRFFGCCESLCMAGVITSSQWTELDDMKNTPVAKPVKVNDSKQTTPVS